MKSDLLKIIKHYGMINQLKYFQGEVFELNEAIITHINKHPITGAIESLTKTCCALNGREYKVSSIEHIIEEIVDVQVMLDQFKCFFGITDEDIKDVMEYKINRQLERIKNEN